MSSRYRNLDGILLLDKPLGVSSNAALQQARGIFRAAKAGHAGSLDPLASGLLPVCFGQATKVCGWLLDSRKTYLVTAKLGARTATGDAEGAVIEERPVPPLHDLPQILESFLGEQLQIPPMYSALKHEGRRLYELARRGEVIEREPRRIVIERLILKRAAASEFELEVRCSKGTYIRTLVEDVAVKMGTVAHVSVLRRVQLDPFDSMPMHSLTDLQTLAEKDPADLDQLLIPADRALAQLQRVDLDESQQTALMHGRSVTAGLGAILGAARAYGPTGRFLGIVEIGPGAIAKPQRLFVEEVAR